MTPPPRNPVVGFHSPLPPAPTGVADYAAALLMVLRQEGEVLVDAPRADVHLYQIGNNPLHTAIYARSLAVPGAVVLHDAVLHHYLIDMPEAAYVEEFVYNSGEWSRELARDLWRNRARSGMEARYFEYPMLRRVAESALTVIVHNPAAAANVRRSAAEARVVEIPHLFIPLPPVDPVEVIRIRSRMGIPHGAYLFAVFGHLREPKRIESVLRAFASVHRELPETALLLSGESVSPDLERSLAPRLQQPGVFRRGYAPEPEFSLLLEAADACINLRHPAIGETSGIAIRMMGMGKPVLLTDGLEISRYPRAACIRIDAGPAEIEMLESYMTWLASHPEDGRRIGRQARQYILEHHDPRRVAGQFWEVLRQAAAQSTSASART